jgi:ElaA protein
MPTALSYQCLPFEKLSLEQLYQIMVLRQEVFIVEQDCPYLDADGKDQASWHLLGTNSAGELLAYTRLVPMGVSYDTYASIGRVVNSPKIRGQGAGRELMEVSKRQLRALWGEEMPVKISAQCYLQRFYESLGFEAIGESYLEDDIPHIAMILRDWTPVGKT